MGAVFFGRGARGRRAPCPLAPPLFRTCSAIREVEHCARFLEHFAERRRATANQKVGKELHMKNQIKGELADRINSGKACSYLVQQLPVLAYRIPCEKISAWFNVSVDVKNLFTKV
jgi:hypothetical protein